MKVGQLTEVLSGSVEGLLPPGRMVTTDEGDGGVQPLWLSDGPATAQLWTRMHAEHARSDLWPLLLDSLDANDDEFRPWASGEVFPEQMFSPARHDPAGLLAQWWAAYTAVDEDDDMLDADRRLAVTAPFGQTWPGLAPSRETATNLPRRPPTGTSGAGRRSVRCRGVGDCGMGGTLQLRQRHREVLRGRP